VPFGLSAASEQTGAPVEQAIDPVLQVFVAAQAVPAAHAAHTPLLQTMLAPQTTPFGCGSKVSAHDATPVAEQFVCPT